ncbi:MAG: segregation/condensation protein A [Alphaproteobacteria bacterium]|nr:segregation/condensation protein A [Alphaproteobacteria bacterium]
MADEEPFEDPAPAVDPATPLVVALDGYEGPIDVLLTLARQQKVDLAKISILQLADQYLAFIAAARRLRLEIAADYLVMAAWLAFLKSRLLLPEPPADDAPSGPEMAEALTFQLRRLEAMREAGTKIMSLPRLGQDVFERGAPDGIEVVRRVVYRVTLYDVLKAYGDQRRRKIKAESYHLAASTLYSMDDALKRLNELLGQSIEWKTLVSYLPPEIGDELLRRSAVAATFAASLELVRSGRIELRQSQAFGPIYVRRLPEDRQ